MLNANLERLLGIQYNVSMCRKTKNNSSHFYIYKLFDDKLPGIWLRFFDDRRGLPPPYNLFNFLSILKTFIIDRLFRRNSKTVQVFRCQKRARHVNLSSGEDFRQRVIVSTRKRGSGVDKRAAQKVSCS